MNKKIALILIAVMFVPIGFTKEISKSFKFGNFDDAKKSSEYIKFTMDSTKVGIITTTFEGYVKDFNITMNKENDFLNNLKVAFEVKKMDTNIDARNEKMWNLCLDYLNHPNVLVMFKGDVKFEDNQMISIPAIIKIRGKEKNLMVNIKATKQNQKTIIEGNAETKLSDLEIPDPSIFVAKVSDLIRINFYFTD